MKTKTIQTSFFRFVFVFSLFFVGATLEPAHAQSGKKGKEKSNKSVKKAAKKQKKKSGGFPSPDVSQSVMAAAYESKVYKYWDSNGSYTGGTYDEELKIEIVKNDEGKVTHVMVGNSGKGKYVPDEDGKSDFVRYYKSVNNNFAIFFAKNRIFFMQVGGPPEDLGTTWEGVTTKPISYGWFEEIETYLKKSRKYQLADLAQYKKDKAAKATADSLARRKKYDLGDKQVASIKIINFKENKHLGNWDGSIVFDIEATLKDGKKISTADGGYTQNYIIDYVNMPGKEYNKIHNSQNIFSNSFSTGFVKDDKVILSVKLRKNPAIKDSKEAVMTYTHREGKVYFDWSASRYGDNGNDLKLEIKKVKHKVTGVDLYQYRVTNLTKNKIIAVAKVRTNQIMYLGSDGQPGTPIGHFNGYDNRGGDGGNGGTITIIKDPNVGSLDGFLQTSVEGGDAGKGNSILTDGRPGRDGKVVFVTKSVSF